VDGDVSELTVDCGALKVDEYFSDKVCGTPSFSRHRIGDE
jgi:hypothetical protein